MSILLNTLSDALPTLMIVGGAFILIRAVRHVTKDTVLWETETNPPMPKGYSWDLIRPTRTMNLE
jgi:hypothetical protein